MLRLNEIRYKIRQIIEAVTVNSENTFNFTTNAGETHQYQVESVTDSTKSVPVDKTNPRGEKKTFNTKVIKLKWLNPPSNLSNAEGLVIVKVCGDDIIKPPRGYNQLPKEFINYTAKLC